MRILLKLEGTKFLDITVDFSTPMYKFYKTTLKGLA